MLSVKKYIKFLSVCLFTIGLLFTSASCLAQFPERELSWKNLSISGNASTVYAIFRDTQGIMWLGTDKGLYFFDGFSTHEVGGKEIGEFHIYALTQKDNRIFIGTNNGLFSFDYATGKVVREDAPLPGEIRTLLLNGDDIWVGSINGIFSYNLKNKNVEDYTSGLPNKSVYSLVCDSRGIIYAGTYNGLARWDSIDKKFASVRGGNDKINSSFFINSMVESEDKRSIYLGGENSFYKYTPSDDKWEKFDFVAGFNVKSLTKGNDQHIIIGTDDGLLDFHEDSIKQYRHDSRLPYSIANNEVWSVFYDDQNNIWAGHERGFSIASNSDFIKNFNLGQLTDKGEGDEITKIYRDTGKNLWLGGSNGLILLTPDASPVWFRHNQSVNSLSHNRVRDILQLSNGSIILATDGGINKYNGRGNFSSFLVADSSGNYDANWAYTLEENGKNLIIGSFLGGILAADTGKFSQTDPHIKADISINSSSLSGLRNNLVNQIEKDGEGNIWVLLFRDNSLIKFNSKMERMEEYDIYDLTGKYPTHIVADHSGRIWCGFKGGALKFDRNGKPTAIYFENRTSDETILAMGAVDDDIWVSTLSNVWKINEKTLTPSMLPIPQKKYTAIYQDPLSGKVLLGAMDEIVEVNAGEMGMNHDFRKVRLVVENKGDGEWNFFQNPEKISKFKLPYGGRLELVVSCLNYTPDIMPRYMYKLAASPSDTIGEWSLLPEGANTISFSDIKWGNYSLMIKTEGENHISISIPLKVEAPPALSWWAISLYVFGIIGIICGIIWLLNRKRKRDLEMQQRKTELENVERKLSFLSTISHDLKTPLSMILGPVSVMKEQVKETHVKKNLDIVYENAVRLNNMIHKTIELQHMEDAGESLLILSIFDVVEFCKGIYDVFRENNPQRKFLFHVSTPKVYIEADAVKMESILTNLLSNACKYSFEGSTISLGIDANESVVEITVSDDGVGISEEDRPLVFQKMFRSPSTSKLQEGTGLGLYLIKRYIELMKGNIELYSSKGEGTTFSLTLPLSQQPETKLENHFEEPTGLQKILIVEDNMQISGFIEDLLKGRFSVLKAENGRSGLAIAASFIPDLIIADEMMPVMSGMDMVRKLKGNPKLATIPIIMLTAKNDNKTETESIKTGIEVFMGKPFDPKSLLERIYQLLKRKKEIIEKMRIEALVENESKPIEAESVSEKIIAKIIRIIEENISDPDLNVELLCHKSGLSNKNLYRLIKKHFGKAPLEFIRTIRLQKAASLLQQKRFTVSEICYMVGFKTPSYFTKCFQNLYGITPSDYMDK